MRQRDVIILSRKQLNDYVGRELREAKALVDKPFAARMERHLEDGMDPAATVRAAADLYREFSAMLREFEPDSVDKLWRIAREKETAGDYQRSIRWKARALGLNPEQNGLDIALSGMTPWHDGERWLLAVAYPGPNPTVFRIGVVHDLVLIDPKTGAAVLHDIAEPELVMPLEHEKFTVHADARHWAREFATSRLEWFFGRRIARKQANIDPIWTGAAPSALAVGDIKRVRWPHAEQITAGVGIDPKVLVASIRRQFHLPRIHTPARAA